MGKQSSRLIYRGKDIKDLVYQGNYLNKLYKGSDLVWQKLYRYFVQSGLIVFDLDLKKYINDTSIYGTLMLKKNQTSAIAILYERESGRRFFAISYDMLRWKEIKELKYIDEINGERYAYSFASSYGGFFVYHYSTLSGDTNTLYFVEIDFDFEYNVKEIYHTETALNFWSQHGTSDYFFATATFRSSSNHTRYNLYRISKNGDVLIKQLMGNFEKDDVNIGGYETLADGNGNTFLICPEIDASNGGTVIFKVQNMDTEHIYIAFWARNVEILNGKRCGIDIIYDYYQTMFIAHRGFEEESVFAENKTIRDGGYYNMAFYVIDSSGNTLLVSQKRDHEIKIKCFGIPGREYLTIKFGGRITLDYRGADVDGIIYFYNVTKGISSSTNDNSSAIFDYDKQESGAGFVGMYSWRDGYTSRYRNVVIFIDNLLMEESENNYVVATAWE